VFDYDSPLLPKIVTACTVKCGIFHSLVVVTSAFSHFRILGTTLFKYLMCIGGSRAKRLGAT